MVQSSGLIALIMGWNYNYSKYIFNGMKANLEGVRKNMFLMYPRFLQMIFDSRYPQLHKTVNILDMKPMAPNSFGMVKAVRKKSKTEFQGLHQLEKFGQLP